MFEYYIRKILLQVEPESGISGASKKQLNDFIIEFAKQFASAAFDLMANRHSRTVTARDIQTTVRILLKGSLAKHAITEGTKAVTKFVSFDEGQQKKKKKHNTTGAKKAGLIIPPIRIQKILRAQLQDSYPDRRIAQNTSVYLAAVIEYLLAEILELSSHVAIDNEKKIITPEMIKKAINNDIELTRTFCGIDNQLLLK